MDIIKQVAKTIAKTHSDTRHNLWRAQENFPLVERVADYLTPTFPFNMEFTTYHPNNSTLFSFRIRDDIVALAVPSGCDCGITDTFDRPDQSEWGISDAGISWPSSSGTASIVNNRGYIESTAFLKNRTISFIPGSTTLTVICQMGTSTDIQDLIEIDFGASTLSGQPTLVWEFEKSGEIRLSCPSASSQNTGSAGFAPTTEHYVKLEVEGTTGRAKVWRTTDSEPSSWTITVTIISDMATTMDTVSLGVYTASTLTQAYFNSLDIEGVDRCTENRFDNFDRTNTTGWGISDTGYTYTEIGDIRVDGNNGELYVNFNLGPSQSGSYIVNSLGPWNVDHTFIGRFWLPSVGTSDDFEPKLEFIFSSSTRLCDLDIGFDNQAGGLDLFGNTEDFFIKTNWIASRWYLIKVENLWSQETIKAKIWLEGTSEPDWQVSTTADSSFSPSFQNRFEVLYSSDSDDGSTTRIAEFSYIDFEYTDKPCY